MKSKIEVDGHDVVAIFTYSKYSIVKINCNICYKFCNYIQDDLLFDLNPYILENSSVKMYNMLHVISA